MTDHEKQQSEQPNVEGQQLDTSQGWCCNGKTYTEHAHEDGECCQPAGKQIEDLPPEAQSKAKDRVRETGAVS